MSNILTSYKTVVQDKEININNCKTVIYIGEVPSDYIQLEYIQSTGTQYLDTGYSDPNGFRVVTKFKQTENPGKWAAVMGTENGDGLNVYDRNSVLSYVEGGGYNKCQFNLGCNNIYYTNVDNELNVWYDLDASCIITNKYVIRDGINLPLTELKQPERSLSKLSLYLFALHTYNGAGLLNKCAMGDTKFYNSNGELINNFVPAKRKLDGAIGMYDAAKNVFLENKGTGEFIAGPEVKKEEVIVCNYKSIIYTK